MRFGIWEREESVLSISGIGLSQTTSVSNCLHDFYYKLYRFELDKETLKQILTVQEQVWIDMEDNRDGPYCIVVLTFRFELDILTWTSQYVQFWTIAMNDIIRGE